MAFRDALARLGRAIFQAARTDQTVVAVPRGACGLSVGPGDRVSFFCPEEEEWTDRTGPAAVLAMAMVIAVRDADLNRPIGECIVLAAIEFGLGQEMGESLAQSFMSRIPVSIPVAPPRQAEAAGA